MKPEEVIELYKEKYLNLKHSRLLAYVDENGVRMDFDLRKNAPGDKAKIPDREAIESFVMNLRFFIQDNEPCSLRNIKKMYEVHCMEDELKKKLNRIITNINQELEIKWAFKINCVELTYREIFDGYIYGRIAHNNRERHSKLLLAIENKMAEHLALVHFIRVLVFTFNMIERIYTINEELIKKL